MNPILSFRRFFNTSKVPAARYSSQTTAAYPTAANGSSSRTRQLVVGGAALVGVIGLGAMGAAIVRDGTLMGSAIGTEQAIWPKYMQQRISETFTAFGVGLAATAATATAFYRSGSMGIFARHPIMASLGGCVASIVAMMVTRSIPADQTAAKFAGLLAFNATMGFALSPWLALGGGLLMRAAAITGGVVGSLSLVAANSPSEKFLWMAGPLSMGLGALVIMNLGALFFPATAAASAIYNISTYGGVALFSGFVLYDTSVIVESARKKPHGMYDAVNESMGIYLDTINIFIRIASILANNNSKRK